MKWPAIIASFTALCLAPCTAARAANPVATLESASVVLDEVMSVPMRSIPASLLADAQGIAIIPNVIKGGFVIGARHGEGVVLTRDEAGRWHGPAFISLTGGSVGWQVGLQSTDVVLVFKTRKSVDGLMNGKFTIGADAAAAAGPVGRQAAAATDSRLQAEIYSYCRSRGLFAGVSIDGSVLQVDQAATTAFYSARPGRQAMLHPSASKLIGRVVHYTQTPSAVDVHPTEPMPLTPSRRMENHRPADVARGRLADASIRLYRLLDDNWKRFLALPAEVFEHDAHPPAAAVGRCLKRFDAAAADPRYRALSARAEFQAAHQMLREYRGVLARHSAGESLTLPPPPK